MTRQRRMYVGILGLALGSLAVDQLLLQGEPSSATAAAQTAAVVEVRLDVVDEPQTVAEVLSSLQHAPAARADLFSIPTDWLPIGVAPIQSPASEPLPEMILTNTLADVAQINGKAIRAGSYVDRAEKVRLVRIEVVGVRVNDIGQDPSAIIEFSGQLYRLRAGSASPEPLVAG